MKFRKKIMMVYLIFSLFASVTIGCMYYIFSVHYYKEKEYINVQTIARVKLQQMEDVISNMSFVIKYFLSDVEVLDALQGFSNLDKNSEASFYYDDSTTVIRKKLTSYYLIDEFNQVIVFNKKGNVFSNTNYGDRILNPERNYFNYPWLQNVSNQGGKNVILGLHEDNWSLQKSTNVISLVKEIQGMNMGYIEVQQDKTKLDEIFAQTDGMTFLVYDVNGNVIYQEEEAIDADYYYREMQKNNFSKDIITSPDGEQQQSAFLKSDLYDFVILTVENSEISNYAIREVLPVSLTIMLGMLLFSIGYVSMTSTRLTKPIRQLQTFIEATYLDNIGEEISEEIENDEIESLYMSYQKTVERLNESMKKEQQISMIQLCAQMDLLQAQVNPHFIYNVLNVISNRGLMLNDEKICEICGTLAGILRYSTDTREKSATVREEVEYLSRYMNLMKERYSYKLLYNIRIDQAILEKKLPKIVLQQIVENAIVHGYEKSKKKMEIQIRGYSDCGWYLSVKDNGEGIGQEKLKEIENTLEQTRIKLSTNRDNVELGIGGMGLINTYARLYLLYKEALVFHIYSDHGKGTEVVFGVKEEV
ncbi:MAG: histidine kinase [Lachnospiraceae bacterium]